MRITSLLLGLGLVGCAAQGGAPPAQPAEAEAQPEPVAASDVGPSESPGRAPTAGGPAEGAGGQAKASDDAKEIPPPDQVKGRLPPEVIREVVKRQQPKVRACYEAALAKDPKLQGKIVVSFTIDPQGKVSETKTGGEFPSQDVVRCVEQVFAAMTFPRPEGTGVVKVSYPLVFMPSS